MAYPRFCHDIASCGISSINPCFRHLNDKTSQEELDAFFEAGYTEIPVLEVILGLAVKVMSNDTNSITRITLDKEVELRCWKTPKIAMRAALKRAMRLSFNKEI